MCRRECLAGERCPDPCTWGVHLKRRTYNKKHPKTPAPKLYYLDSRPFGGDAA